MAIETNGTILDDDLIKNSEYLICDVKNQWSDDLVNYEKFLAKARDLDKKVELTCVIVPSVNDTSEKLTALRSLRERFSETVMGIRLLPFRKLCVEKYKKLNLEFPYADKDECSKENIEKAYKILN